MKKFILVPLMFSVIFFLFAATLWENEVPIRLGANIIWNSSGAKTADGGVIYVWSDTRRGYRDWETDRKSTRLNSSHSGESRMPSSA